MSTIHSYECANLKNSSYCEYVSSKDQKTDAEMPGHGRLHPFLCPNVSREEAVGQLRPHDRDLTAFPPSFFLAIKPLHPHVSISGADVGRVVEEGASPS